MFLKLSLFLLSMFRSYCMLSISSVACHYENSVKFQINKSVQRKVTTSIFSIASEGMFDSAICDVLYA